MSGERNDRAFNKPFRKPAGPPYAKPFGKPAAGFRNDSGGQPGSQAGPRPWKTRLPEGSDNPPAEPRESRPDDTGAQPGEETQPQAGKFYEPFLKRPKAKRTEPRDDREGQPGRGLQSSERPQRIPSSAGARNYEDRPRRDVPSSRDNPLPSNEGPGQLGASSGLRRDFSSSARRDEGPRRDAPRDRPFNRDQNFDRRPDRSDAGFRRPPSDGRRPEYPRDGGPDRRPWQDRRREPGTPSASGNFRPDPRDERDSRPRRFDRPAPHLEKRVIRSEGAKADQPFAARQPFEEAAPLSAAREIAARVLLRRLQASSFVEDLLDDAFATTKMRPDDRRLTQEMVYGCVRWQGTLDWLVARKTGDRPQIPQVQVFLRLGLYQLFFLDRIPPHAACYETVEIAKRLGFEYQANFINAILRRCDAERAEIKLLLAELQATQPHVGFSHPEWLVQKWTARWGADDTRKLLEWNNTAPLTHIRVNTLKTTPVALLDRWRLKESVEYDFVRCPWADEGHVFALKQHPSLAVLESFREGWFYVQDPSTLLAVQALDPWAGETILDLCAAPGGKTAYIAQKMENDGELIACDQSADRLKLVKENCTRLGVTCVKTLALGDHPEAALEFRKFDKVLVDAPCSNTGVLRRRLDLRWRVKPEELERLCETQLKLLHLAASRVKPGGILVYSTCSLEPEENSEQIKAFLASHPHYKLESERELIPFRDGVDGAYVAKLRN